MHYDESTITLVRDALIITLKDPLHRFVSKLSQDEFLSTVEFVLFAFRQR